MAWRDLRASILEEFAEWQSRYQADDGSLMSNLRGMRHEGGQRHATLDRHEGMQVIDPDRERAFGPRAASRAQDDARKALHPETHAAHLTRTREWAKRRWQQIKADPELLAAYRAFAESRRAYFQAYFATHSHSAKMERLRDDPEALERFRAQVRARQRRWRARQLGCQRDEAEASEAAAAPLECGRRKNAAGA